MSGCGNRQREGLQPGALDSPLDIDANSGSGGRCGNDASYVVEGKTYQVLPSARGYREEGLASWYGAEFQGMETAGCETFDMHAFSAAHRTLPLPSYVRVTHLGNGQSVVVRVNDRGPFDGGGLIQLSFAAANALGMGRGQQAAPVRVEGLEDAAVKEPPKPPMRAPARDGTGSRQPVAGGAGATRSSGKNYYVVVNNYRDQEEALDMFVRLTSVGLSRTELASAIEQGQKMHQVRVGPLYTQDQIDNVKDMLESNGLATFRVIGVNQ
ncbi:MAG: septal ring lytic transglycosylase RlpA family protein [Thiothrix sp.]|nr:septal ring lytic transglycosylase RlpA family protein [Thiothrix sp.]